MEKHDWLESIDFAIRLLEDPDATEQEREAARWSLRQMARGLDMMNEAGETVCRNLAAPNN